MGTANATLEALGDPTRRAMLEHLRRRPMAVGELASHLPVSRPAVSQHLKVLKGAGLVTERANGARHIYALDAAGFAEARAYVESMWEAALGSFKAFADAAGRRERGADVRKKTRRGGARWQRERRSSR